MKRILILLLSLVTANSWADVKAFLNQTTVFDGDPVTLTIESDNSATKDPDLSVLNKDFHIQGTSQGSSSNFSFNSIDGNTSSYTKTWTIQLVPRQKGKIEIPVIRLGSESTLPLMLTVTDLTPDIISKNSQHVTLEASVEIGQSLPYVQQQIPYVIKLYSDETITKGDFFAPSVENAVVEKLSRDKQYSIVRNGKKLNVLERHYVISPEKSGMLVIPPAIFKGEQTLPRANGNPGANNKQRSRGGFADNFFNDPFFNDSFFGSAFAPPGKPITTRSDSIEIPIQPIPTVYKGTNWLPAEDLVIIDSWEKNHPVFKVGEPVMRILTLQTKGLAGSQIPELLIDTPEKIRVYPDKATTETKTDGKTVFGVRQQSINYIPNTAGKVLLPAVKIDWWNVVTKTQESFTLPEKEIQILPGVRGSEQQMSLDKDKISEGNEKGKREKQENQDSLQDENAQSSITEQPDSNKWLLGLLIFTGVCGLSAFIFLRLRNRKKQIKPMKVSSVATKLKLRRSHLLNKLEQACNDNNRNLVAKLLLELAEAEWPNNPPKNLGTLADEVENGAELIRALDKSLYADRRVNDDEVWNGRHLWEVIKVGLQSKSRKKGLATNDGVAVSLYPDRS